MIKKEDAIELLTNYRDGLKYRNEPTHIIEAVQMALDYMQTDGDRVPYKDYKDLLDSQTPEEIVRCADCKNYVYADDIKPDPNCWYNYCWKHKLNHPTGNMYCYFAERKDNE